MLILMGKVSRRKRLSVIKFWLNALIENICNMTVFIIYVCEKLLITIIISLNKIFNSVFKLQPIT